MHVSAALLPPRDVLDRVLDLVASVEPEWTARDGGGPPGRHAGGGLNLFRRRREPGGAGGGPRPSEPMLDLLAPIRVSVTIAKFGNLSLFDANRLADALEQEAEDWPTPRLNLAGAVALEPEGDDSVWIPLAGDLDELRGVYRGVTDVAKRLQLFVDRRVFRPQVRIATINGRTTETYLEKLLAVLEPFESSAWWQNTLSLLTPADQGPGRQAFRSHRDITLGPPVAH